MSTETPAATPATEPTIDRGAEGELTAALAKAQAAFPPIAKDNTATVPGKNGKSGYSYSYADLAAVLAAVRPVLAEQGLALVQQTSGKGTGVVLTTTLRHVGGATIESTVELGQSSANPQQFGGALTYLRRYELVTLLGIAAEEDRDAQDVTPPGREPAPAPAELPPWAQQATAERRREVGPGYLVELMGRDRALEVLAAIEAGIGVVPDVCVATIKLVVDKLLEGDGADVLEGLGTIRAARRDATVEAERQAADDAAKADADRGQVAAEQPDTPAPEPEPDPPAEDPPPPAGPAPGTVDVDIHGATSDAEAIARYREGGCTCPKPTAPADEADAHDDACPVRSHGIPS